MAIYTQDVNPQIVLLPLQEGLYDTMMLLLWRAAASRASVQG